LLIVEQAFSINPSDAELENNVAIAYRVPSKSHYYDEARKLGSLTGQTH
jgi:hypothetical protein